MKREATILVAAAAAVRLLIPARKLF